MASLMDKTDETLCIDIRLEHSVPSRPLTCVRCRLHTYTYLSMSPSIVLARIWIFESGARLYRGNISTTRSKYPNIAIWSPEPNSRLLHSRPHAPTVFWRLQSSRFAIFGAVPCNRRNNNNVDTSMTWFADGGGYFLRRYKRVPLLA